MNNIFCPSCAQSLKVHVDACACVDITLSASGSNEDFVFECKDNSSINDSLVREEVIILNIIENTDQEGENSNTIMEFKGMFMYLL